MDPNLAFLESYAISYASQKPVHKTADDTETLSVCRYAQSCPDSPQPSMALGTRDQRPQALGTWTLWDPLTRALKTQLLAGRKGGGMALRPKYKKT